MYWLMLRSAWECAVARLAQMKKYLLDSSFVIDLLNEMADDEAGPALRWLKKNPVPSYGSVRSPWLKCWKAPTIPRLSEVIWRGTRGRAFTVRRPKKRLCGKRALRSAWVRTMPGSGDRRMHEINRVGARPCFRAPGRGL